MAVRDILTDEQLDAWLADPNPEKATVIGLDLSTQAPSIGDEDLRESLFLGCAIPQPLATKLVGSGCPVLPQFGTLPIPLGRRTTYRVSELYSDFDPDQPGSWERTLDHAAWSWFIDPVPNQPRPLDTADLVAARVHDATIEAALTRTLQTLGRPVVGVMGGHDTPRSKPLYGDIARFARAVTRRGRVVATGGGPGLMEAANLGAFLAPYHDEELDKALETLHGADDFKSHDWLATACEVRTRALGDWRNHEQPGSASIGVPTWLYGNEPPNMFATHSAKLFFNSVREDGLVSIADGGILFAEGNAGTVQEIFQDATQNYYRRTDKDAARPTPMVLFGREYWSRPVDEPPVPDPATGKVMDKRKPLMPLMTQLAAEKSFTDAVLSTSSLDEALEHLAPAADVPRQQSLAWRLA